MHLIKIFKESPSTKNLKRAMKRSAVNKEGIELFRVESLYISVENINYWANKVASTTNSSNTSSIKNLQFTFCMLGFTWSNSNVNYISKLCRAKFTQNECLNVRCENILQFKSDKCLICNIGIYLQKNVGHWKLIYLLMSIFHLVLTKFL